MKAIQTQKVSMEVRLSTLWIVVMLNMAFADILSIVLSSALKENVEAPASLKITQELMLVSAILIEIPIVMIFLSRILNYKANRWANIITAVITILFVIGGGASYLHYLFFAAFEIICLLLIIWYSWQWKREKFE
jgi:Sec-independent protein secretion pathway component TatC